MKKLSIGGKLAAAGGRPAGFDYMRLGLSVAVVLMHSAITSYGVAGDLILWESPARGMIRLILPMFFALSGFLVGGSLERCKTLVMFVGLRIIRIYPALCVEVVLSAFLVGPIVTTMPLHDYFQDSLFARYLLNVTGDIHFLLPGVFSSNPFPDTVNAQLWTVPFELYCYITLTIAGLLGVKRYRIIAPLAAVGICTAHLGGRLILHHGHYVIMAGGVPGPLLVAYFMGGLSIYLYRNQLAANRFATLASALVAVIAIALPFGEYLALAPACYLTACLGVSNPPRIRLIRGADYSYGIFLYGFMIQQTLMFAVPGLREWYWNAAIALPVATMIAALSWNFVEKPALKMKVLVTRAETMWLRLRGRLPVPGWREQAFVRPSMELDANSGN